MTKQRAFFVPWKALERWIPPSRLASHSHLPEGWVMVRLGDQNLLRQVKERVKVEPDQEYKMVGVRWYGEGTFHRETVLGKNLSATYVTPVIPGAFMYNRLFAWKGSFAVVPPEHGDCFVSSEFPQFLVDETRLSARYLYLFFMRAPVTEAVNAASIGSAAVSRNRFKEDEFLGFRLTLPPLPVQQAIVARWEAAQAEIQEARQQAKTLEDSAEELAITQAGIYLHELKQRPKVLTLQWRDFERWGVQFNRWDWKLTDLLTSNLFPMKRMEEVAEVNPTDISKIKDMSLPVSFIPMEAVSDKEGVIFAPQVRRFLEVSKGYTRFMADDVIWAKITPCMQNGKCAVAKQLENGLGFGSTEFHVIRSKNKETLLPEYLWVLLRMKHLRQAAQRYFIGSAGQQRVPADFLAGLYIPVPPLDIQREIVQQVQAQRAEIARLRAEAERKTREIKADVEALILGSKQIEENPSSAANRDVLSPRGAFSA